MLNSELYDQTTDLTGQKLHRLYRLYPRPDFVKNASQDQILGVPEQMQLHMYGDPRFRRYPCHSAAATWVSTACLWDKKAAMHPDDFTIIDGRLSKAAEYFGISTVCGNLREKVAEGERDEFDDLTDDMFAVVFRSGPQSVERHYPLRNSAEVVKAAESLKQYREQFRWSDRHTIAEKILTKAAAYGTQLDEQLDDFLEQQAGRGHCAQRDAVVMLRKRAMLADNYDLRAGVEKLAQIVEENPGYLKQPANRLKLAELVDNLDRELRITRQYGEDLQPPEEVLFAVTEKQASSFLKDHISLTSGNVYKVADLRQMPLSHLRDWMGDSFVEEVSTGGTMLDTQKFASIARTLPRPDAEILDRCLSEQGITPFAKEAAHQAVGISREALWELAQDAVDSL